MIMRAIAAVCGVLLLVSTAGAQGRWELIGSADGVDTYRMTHPGTEVCTFKGVGFVDAKIEIIGEVFRDIPAFPQWMANCKSATILKTIDRNTYIINTVISAPFPYQDRDMVVENQSIYNFDNGTALLTFRLARNFDFPEQSCCLRLTDLEGQYYFEYFGRNKTRVTYQYRSDPGGNVPVGMANEFQIKHYPAINIAGLREMVKKEKYIKAGLASPEHGMIERMLDDKNLVVKILKKRIGEYIIDPVLLGMLFEMTATRKIVDKVYVSRSDFESIRQGMVDLFNVMAAKGPTGTLKQELDIIAAYLADKEFESFFSMEKFMGERWLVDAIAREKKLVHALFDMESPLSKVVLEKVTTSPTVVRLFIKDRQLAERILTDAALRKKLWADKTLRDRLADDPDTFKSAGAFENLIAERVKSYSL